jgi:hypothetical protein
MEQGSKRKSANLGSTLEGEMNGKRTGDQGARWEGAREGGGGIRLRKELE